MNDIDRKSLVPPSVWRIYETSAKIPSPVVERFTAKTTNGATKLYLYDMIGEGLSPTAVSADEVVRAIDAAQASGSKALEIYINSPGGMIAEGMSIYAAIRRFKGSRTVYVDGWAASIASVIALAGDRVISGVGSSWMVHEPSGAVLAMGRRSEVRNAWQKADAALASLHESILDVYEARTKQPRETLDAWMRAETYMTAREAMERGFTDEIADAPETSRARVAAQAEPVALAEDTERRIASGRQLLDLKMGLHKSAQQLDALAGGRAIPGQPGPTAATRPLAAEGQTK
jgi:ATP-dependent Clp protease, protease subunit